jgi:hypothetical protein
MFFNAPAMNAWIKAEGLDEKYPKPTLLYCQRVLLA